MLKKTLICAVLAFSTFHTSVSLANTVTPKTVENSISDTAITAKVKVLYAKSSLIKASNISVKTMNNTVFLTGKVATDHEYEEAISLARSVAEVTDVNANKLKVTTSKYPLNDTYITAKVKGVLLKERLFGDKEIEYWPVKVETKNGVVYLTGKVDTNEQRTNIVNIITNVDGVKSVNSVITVK